MKPAGRKVPHDGDSRRASRLFPFRAPRSPALAFTRAEPLAVLVALTLLAAVAWPALAHNKPRTQRSACVNNLRQVGQALRVWAADHGDRFPWLIPVNQGGSQGRNQAYEQFRVISNALATARQLACPSDLARAPTNLMDNLRSNRNVSYFVGLHANEAVPETFLAGDRDILGNASAGNCAVAGNIVVTRFSPFSVIRWSLTNHVDSGNFLFSDGSIRVLSTPSLKRVILNPKVTEFGQDSHILKPLLAGETP